MFISTNFVAIFLGVISGIATSVILWLITILYKKVLLPFIEQMVYRGVNITGDWSHIDNRDIEIGKDQVEKIKNSPTAPLKKIVEEGVKNPDGSVKIKKDFEITISIKQKAHYLSGYFRAKSIKNGSEYINYFKIKGVIKDNYAVFNYDAERSDRTGMGSFILRVANGGTQLIGSAIFTPDGTSDDTIIVSRENMNFVRK